MNMKKSKNLRNWEREFDKKLSCMVALPGISANEINEVTIRVGPIGGHRERECVYYKGMLMNPEDIKSLIKKWIAK